MLEQVLKLGVAGCVGVLMGFLLVAWVQPTTAGGANILIVICVAFCTIVGGLVSAVLSRKVMVDQAPKKSDEPL